MITSIEHGPVGELRLNRPPANALSAEMMHAIRESIQAAPKEGVRALVISGSPGMFSAGLDVPLLLMLDRAGVESAWRALYAMMEAVARSPIPIVAAITGHAPAGGTVLTLFCDYRIAAEGNWKLGLNEVQVGIPLPAVIFAGLRRLVGLRYAEYLSARGELVSPQRALGYGLVDEIAGADRVVDRAIEWCRELLALPASAILATRKQARSDVVHVFDQDLSHELEGAIAAWWSEETQQVLKGLAQKLKPASQARSM
jgi:enoyl-CoA hydratase/carnithine racemase